MRTPDELFGLEVQAQREHKGWSMTEFAAMLSAAGLTNFHPTTVGRMERGERPVRLNEAVVIADVLGSTLNDLVVEPLEGNEGVLGAIGNVEDLSKKAARCLDSVDFWRDELKKELDLLASAMAAGKILDEHLDGAREACSQAESVLQSDRVKSWLDKLRAMAVENRRALFDSDRAFHL